MNRTKYIIRIIFVLLTVFLLIYLNRKTDNNTESIAEFKLKMIEKIRTDSLDSKNKLDLLVNETTKFVDDSSHVREGIHYLMRMLGLWVVIELVFLLLEKRNYRRHEIK
jgi:regulatory protein YycI of two-component signal transduction system YycFG